MIEIWYGIVAFMMITYVLLDGRNFGAGVLHLFVARTQDERRQVIAAVGPLWVWHETWIVAFGGTLFVAFPKLLADSFSGYYLALFLILWCLAFRGIALEAGGHIPDKMWQSFWDVIFAVSNYLLAILFGVALGNLSRGVPVGDDGTFSMSFFTDFTPFSPQGNVGLLDWYTVSMALVVLVFLAAHGATYLVLRTEGPVHDRSVRYMCRLWSSLPLLMLIIGLETWLVRPQLAGDFLHHPIAWVFLAVIVVGAVMIFTGIRTGDEKRSFYGSGTLLVGMLAAGAATIYPTILHSTVNDQNSLTAQNTAATRSSLELAMIWWPFAGVMAFGYLWYIARFFSGKVDVKPDGIGP
jgi:cytochrome d ubiquinol oxidase subunit II